MSFPTTYWTQIIADLGNKNDTVAAAALVQFCQRYRDAIEQFFRQRGCNEHDAEEYTARFFETQIHKKWAGREGFLFSVNREKTPRFRSLLAGTLYNFCKDQWSRDKAIKRGGGFKFVPIETTDFAEGEIPDTMPAEFGSDFDRTFALNLIRQATRNSIRSRAVLAHLAGEITQEEAAKELGITVAAFKLEFFRFRKRLREHLLKEVVKVAGPDEQEIKDEIRYLLSLFSR